MATAPVSALALPLPNAVVGDTAMPSAFAPVVIIPLVTEVVPLATVFAPPAGDGWT